MGKQTFAAPTTSSRSLTSIFGVGKVKTNMASRFLLVILLVCLVYFVFIGAFQMVRGDDLRFFGYPYTSNEAIGSGHHEEAVGSRFTLTTEAGVTSVSCLMQKDVDPGNPSAVYSFAFAIYTDKDGAIGSLVAQTVQGVVSNTVLRWQTLSFSSPVNLVPGAYWLLVVHDAVNFVMISDVYNSTSPYKTVTSDIGGLVFPALLSSPIYTPGMVCCIYASFGLPDAQIVSSPSPSPTSTPLNATPTSFPSVIAAATSQLSNETPVSEPPSIVTPTSLPPSIAKQGPVTSSPASPSPSSSSTTSVTPLPITNQTYPLTATASPQYAETTSDQQPKISPSPPELPPQTASLPLWLWVLVGLMAFGYIFFSLMVFLVDKRNDKKKKPIESLRPK